MSNVGNLQVELELNDKGFTVTTRKAGDVVKEFGGSLQTVDRAMERHEQGHQSLTRSFRNVMVTVAATRFALMDLNGVLGFLPRSILKAGGELEKLTQLMKGLSKETTEAAKNADANKGVSFITNMAQRAPYEIKTIADSFVKLKSAGIDPTNGSLQALIDSVAKFGGTSETLHRSSIAIQQMAGKGVISMEELRQQLGEAIPTAMLSMARGLGMSMSELTKAVSKGMVQSMPALQRMFLVMNLEAAGAADKMMGTWVGMTAQMGTQWTLFQKMVFDGEFGKEMKKLAQDITAAFKEDDVKRFAYQLSNTLATGVSVLKETAIAAKDAWPAIKLLGEAMIAYFVASRVVDGITAIKNSLKAHRDAVVETTAANVNAVLAKNNAAIAEAASDNVRLEKKIAYQAAERMQTQTHLNGLITMQAAHQAKLAALQATTQFRVPAGQPGAGQFASADALRQVTLQAQANLIQSDALIAKRWLR